MVKIIQIKYNLFSFILFFKNNVIGKVQIKLGEYNQGVLNIFIRKRWRCRWLLLKKLIINLQDNIINFCYNFNIKLLITKLNNKKSLPLLLLFNFKCYKDKVYFLNMEVFYGNV